MENFGGCEIVQAGTERPASFVFAGTPYHYSLQELFGGQRLDTQELRSFTLFISRLEGPLSPP